MRRLADAYLGSARFYEGRWHDEPLYSSLADEFNARYQPKRSGRMVSGDLP